MVLACVLSALPALADLRPDAGPVRATRTEGEPADEAATERDELAMVALEGLIGASPERTLPLVKRVLEGKRSDAVKKRALFLLSQMNRPEATALLLEMASTRAGVLQREAIRSIGISGDPASLARLVELGKKDPQVQRQVLEALLISGKPELVYQLALEASSPQAFDQAIDTLSAMGATRELRALRGKGRVTSHLVRAFGISGDLESLSKLLGDDVDGGVEVQLEAVRAIGLISSKEARVTLRELYKRAPRPELKHAALQSLMISGDEDTLLSLYRAATAPAEKRELLRILSTMNGDKALEAIDSALEEK
jgi:HEAT repeat protein